MSIWCICSWLPVEYDICEEMEYWMETPGIGFGNFNSTERSHPPEDSQAIQFIQVPGSDSHARENVTAARGLWYKSQSVDKPRHRCLARELLHNACASPSNAFRAKPFVREHNPIPRKTGYMRGRADTYSQSLVQ